MSVIDVIKHYQRSIEKCSGNQERMLHCIGKLYRLPVTVQHLQDTGVGRTVNALRKYEGDTGEAAKALVAKWKAMVAAEEPPSSDGEDQQEDDSSPPPVEQSPPPPQEYKPVKDKPSQGSHSSSRKHREEEKPRKSNSREESRKRRNEEENGEIADKRKRKQEVDSECSEQEYSFRDNESGNDSETKSTSHSRYHVNDSNSESMKHHNSHRKHKESSNREKNHKREEKVKDKTETKHRKEHSSDKKHKSSKTGSHSNSNQESPKSKSVKVKKEKTDNDDDADMEEDGSIDCSTGASFAEALGMVDPVVKKKPHTTTSSPGTSSSSSTPRHATKTSHSDNSGSSSKKKERTLPSSPNELGLLSPNMKLEPLDRVHVDVDVDVDSTLPAINLNYKPLPHFNFLDSPPHRKTKSLTEEEALCQVMSTKNQRTKVYSGVKGKSWAQVPSLYDICVRVLQENIDALEYTGGVPYDLLKPVLQHATAEQLFSLEHYNPYLIEETNELWQFHCQREFRSKQRQDMETAREMYLRCLDEREAKLKALTSNIQQSIAKSTPVRQTKLAYVDSVAKPPRNVARQQAKYGTARVIKSTPAAKAARVNAAAAAASAAIPVPPPRHVTSVTKAKPRMAPLMQKTMKLVKSFKR